jgi:serine protease Do
LGDSSALRIGEWVVAIGNALGEGISVTQGIISAKGRTIGTEAGCQLPEVLQTDAAINPGNSGGPLINLSGEVVGINTAIARGAEGIGYAISMDRARPIIQQLIDHGPITGDPYVGVQYTPVDAGIQQQFRLAVSQGILVTAVISGGPAQRAGIRAGDVLTIVDGKTVVTSNDFSAAIDARKVGDRIDIQINRYGQMRAVNLTLGETPRTCSG